jgi:hypothetical protein
MGALHMRGVQASLCCWENADDNVQPPPAGTYAVESVNVEGSPEHVKRCGWGDVWKGGCQSKGDKVTR